MNVRFAFQELHGAILTPAPARPVSKSKTKQPARSDMLQEVVAGFLWMQLDLPEDVRREEIDNFAHHLVARIRAGADEDSVERELAILQCGQLCRPLNRLALRALARRARAAVKGA